MTGTFFGGTSGLQINMPKRDFPEAYADKSRLGYYALQENSLEVNSSFYKLPQAKTISKWAAEVPESFRFTFKLWKAVTHQKQLPFATPEIQGFMTAIAAANDRQGALLIQFPPSLNSSAFPQLTALLDQLSPYGWPLAVEFRHSSWYSDETYEILHQHQAALVIQDMPASATPLELTADDWAYLRFHGPSGNYKGSYDNDFLYEYAGYIREWLDEGKTVYAYFNNTAGTALSNLQTLKQYIKDGFSDTV